MWPCARSRSRTNEIVGVPATVSEPANALEMPLADFLGREASRSVTFVRLLAWVESRARGGKRDLLGHGHSS